MLCPGVSEEYGGVGADSDNMVIAEEVSRLGLTGIGFSLHNDVTTPNNVANGRKRKNFCPAVSQAIALSLLQ